MLRLQADLSIRIVKVAPFVEKILSLARFPEFEGYEAKRNGKSHSRPYLGPT